MLLMAQDGRHFLRLDLLPLGRRHRGWHGYRIVVGDVERGETAKLEATSGMPLFLDCEVSPEIPALADGLERALAGATFSFTPVDEGDFELSATRSAEGAKVRVQSRYMPFNDETGWPLGLEVSGPALRRFAAGLRLEYLELIPGLPLA